MSSMMASSTGGRNTTDEIREARWQERLRRFEREWPNG
jgi:hypothetical protein